MINREPRHSDHQPVIVVTDPPNRVQRRRGEKSFQFEAEWVKEEQCPVIVENAWRLSVDVLGGRVQDAVKNVARDLGDWSRNVLGDLEKRIKRARSSLEACRRGAVNNSSVGREEILRYKLDRLEEQRNLYWRQRAKVHWLKEGDRNTRFYHQYASERRRRSRIMRLVQEDGGVVEEEEAIKNLVANSYKDLFTSHAGTRLDELLMHVQSRVSMDMNEFLVRPFTKEVKQGLDAIGDLKAPGADGMPSLFYKKHWDIVGEM
jgi:hypothetical protein